MDFVRNPHAYCTAPLFKGKMFHTRPNSTSEVPCEIHKQYTVLRERKKKTKTEDFYAAYPVSFAAEKTSVYA